MDNPQNYNYVNKVNKILPENAGECIKRVLMMNMLEIQETIKKKITVIRKTIITPGIEAIIAIPKRREHDMDELNKNG